MPENENQIYRLLDIRNRFSENPYVNSAEIIWNNEERTTSPHGHPKYKLERWPAELVVIHKNGRDRVTYHTSSNGNIIGVTFGKVPKTARERLAEIPTPTTPLEALVLLLTIDEAALEEGITTTEEVQERWERLTSTLKDS